MLTYKTIHKTYERLALCLLLCAVLIVSLGAMPALAADSAVSFSATPKLSGRAVLSPGGTDRMVFQYSYRIAGAVTIAVKVGKVWKTVLAAAESTPGVSTYSWDGKIGGKALRPGIYQAKLTTPDGTRTIKIRILPRPGVTLYSLKPATFTATGSSTVLITARWTQLCNVRIDIVNAAGTTVRSLYAAQNRPATTKKLRWDGRDDQGQMVPSGVYRVRVQCGGAAAVTRKLTVRSTVATTNVTITLTAGNTTATEAQESRLTDLINGARQANGLQPLAVNSTLHAGALKHSQDMAARNFFDHVSPTYGDMATRMKAAGISYWYAGENLALTGSADSAYQQFMASDGHRANILKPEYTNIGVAFIWNVTAGQYDVTVWFADLQ